MILSIITINRDNASGLEQTIQSVLSQSMDSFEFVIVDGASTDGSVDVIQKYVGESGVRLKWVSEPDSGIYNAMNKGIDLASGEYLEFLNSGDCLASDNVVEKVFESLEKAKFPPILYGNMLKDMNGRVIRDRSFGGESMSFLSFYRGTLNHSSSFIRKDLFYKYGKYDEDLKIVSDWKWFLQAIVLGGEEPVYTDLDVSIFDMNGISETNKKLAQAERKHVLEQFFPVSVLADYEKWFFHINQMKRLKRHPWAYIIVWFIERCLFKMEKR